VGAVCTVVACFVVRDTRRRASLTPWQHAQRFDYLGTLLLTGGLVLLILAATQAVAPTPNLSSHTALGCLIAFGAAALVAFVLVEAFVAVDPIIPLEV
jgi:hypothetical protein